MQSIGQDLYRVRKTEVENKDEEILEHQKIKKLPTILIRDIDDSSYDSEEFDSTDMQESNSQGEGNQSQTNQIDSQNENKE